MYLPHLQGVSLDIASIYSGAHKRSDSYSNLLGSPLRGDASPSRGAKLGYVTLLDVTLTPDADGSTDGREG